MWASWRIRFFAHLRAEGTEAGQQAAEDVVLRGQRSHREIVEHGAIGKERVLLWHIAGAGIDAFDGLAANVDLA